MRMVRMRKRPASFTAAAPPSSFQVTQSVRLMELSVTSKNTIPMVKSLVVSVVRVRMPGSVRERLVTLGTVRAALHQ